MKTELVIAAAAAAFAAVGGVDCVKVSDFGYDAADSTAIVQKALDSGARKVVVDAGKGPWTVGPLFVRSDTEVVFEEGAQLLAKPGDFMPLRSALVSIVCATNVTLRGLGSGATLRMRIKDYQNPPYQKGEWRHAVNIMSAKNVLVENLLLADSGGDGVYLGVKVSRCPCENVTIRRCICDNNNRQGISVISARHLLIEDTVMKNTRGTNPKAGIDFEPNNASEVLIDCVMRNCLTEGNDGAGYDFYLGQFNATTQPISITLENCRSVGDRRSPLILSFNPIRHGKGLPKGGFLKVKGCTFSNSPSRAVSIADKPAGVVDVTFEDCVFDMCSASHPEETDVSLGARTRISPATGGVSFRNVTIRRRQKGEWFGAAKRPWRQDTLAGVTGDVTVCADGECSRIVLDDAWRKEHESSIAGGVKYALDAVPFDPANVRVVDTAPGMRVKLSPMRVRYGSEAIVYAAKPGPVTFALKLAKIGRKNVKAGPMVVRSISGRKVATLPAPELTVSDRTFNAPKAGFYTIGYTIKPHALVFTESDAPLAIRAAAGAELDIFASRGPVYFAHESGVDATLFCCGGGGERVTARLFDPAGKMVREWVDMGEWGFERIAPDAPAGLWRLELSRPSKRFIWEDSFLDLTGAPPVFFLSPEKFWCSTR